MTEMRLCLKLLRILNKFMIQRCRSVSVIHLGLIYDIEILEDNTVVKITHTLTSAFCPMADEINQNIQQAGMVEGVKESIAHCTFQPPFSMDMVPEETKMVYGLGINDRRITIRW